MTPRPLQSRLDKGEKPLVRLKVLSRVPVLARKANEGSGDHDDPQPKGHQIPAERYGYQPAWEQNGGLGCNREAPKRLPRARRRLPAAVPERLSSKPCRQDPPYLTFPQAPLSPGRNRCQLRRVQNLLQL